MRSGHDRQRSHYPPGGSRRLNIDVAAGYESHPLLTGVKELEHQCSIADGQDHAGWLDRN